jgi:endonuclease/exonuclease/phosphatase family metal-dependent hydrolase
MEPIAGGMIAACAIGALVIEEQKRIKVDPKLWSIPILALILLVLPVAQVITWRTPTAVPGEGFPLTVMTYNLNNGFNPKGQLDIDEIAKVIETNRPDIVALQEVSRGWVVNGRLDTLAWLSYRLQMPYVFEPTGDPFWGNAILSRYPITAYSRENLPPPDALIQRGFLVALIDTGEYEPMKVITTQFDTLAGDTDIRQLQTQKIIDFWGGLDNTVLLGDFSAPAQSQEIAKLYQANLGDAALQWKYRNTFPSNDPQERRDYIWTSHDIVVSDGGIPPSTASDHLPVVAVINR